ncbi:MAG TPA: phenylalanine--tRNA ligase subunit beta [Candidatus Eisenbacteria bacterium]|nr:phenylalanine--tRNA ligase subunit beta [Candidatus Eisenbacteria bacterium]
MKVTWSWLGDWTGLPESPEALAHLLATRGLPVESLEKGTAYDPTIVVGHVLEVAPHPNADRLRLCKVDLGGAVRSIVCGASNVAAGQRVAVAQIGSRLPDGTKLKKAKIRGIESEGMICSEKELGLSAESEGIWVLPGSPVVGMPLTDLLGSGDAVLDVEITSNRTDCMAVRGLARDVAAARGERLKDPPALRATGKGDLPRVTIENAKDCPRYMARVVTGLRIGPSPDWLRRRLEATGFRSINNVVDVTNYVLREYGQPIHAFDAAKVGGQEIRVRRARGGESLTLLDGRKVALGSHVQVIADASVPMALAGIMGGLDSGVTDATTSVVLESAQFDPGLTKEAARSLGVETDASTRFGQGVDPDGVALALDATARLLAEVADGTVVDAVVDQWPGKSEPRAIALRLNRLSRLLGIPVAPDTATRALASLEIAQQGAWVREGDETVGVFLAPRFRKDLEIEEDLIEEVARGIGYDAVPATVAAASVPAIAESPERAFAARVVDVAVGLGFDEAIGPALVGDIPVEAREGIEDASIWEIQNPKSRELKHLRVSLLPGLLAIAARNARHGVADVRLAEVGKVFQAQPPPLGSERLEAAFLLTGSPDLWNRPGAESDRYLELRGAVEALYEALGIDSWQGGSYHDACWARGTGSFWSVSESRLGRMGEVAPSLARQMGLTQPAWAAIVDLAAALRAAPRERRYREVPRFPASKRDLAVVVRPDVTHEDLAAAIRAAGGPLLHTIRLFDVYKFRDGEHAGRSSLAYALEFRSAERTLTDREVEEAFAAIVRALESKLGAALRGGAEVHRA